MVFGATGRGAEVPERLLRSGGWTADMRLKGGDHVLDLALTIVAWRKGWRWRALLPMCGLLVVSMFAGFCIGMADPSSLESDMTPGSLNAIVLVALLPYLGTLIWMATRPPKRS